MGDDMRVYLDNCCYNRPYDDQSQIKVNLETRAKLDIQRRIREGTLELAASYVLVAENSANHFENKRKDIQAFIDKYAKIYVSYNSIDEVNRLASEIMKAGIKPADASHVACAVIAECDCLITTDKRLLKYSTDRIRLMNPIEFITEMEE